MSLRDRFSDRARRTFQLANQEARKLRHASIEAEHVLLGLLRDDSGVAAYALKSLHFDHATIAMEVERLLHPGMGSISHNLPCAPSADRVIGYAIEEARRLNHNYVGTEHILLALLREQEGVTARVLKKVGADLDRARAEIVRILEESSDPDRAEELFRTRIVANTTDADKEFFLGLYRSAVGFYQPKIEKRTGVSLGPIGIWDYGQLHPHVVRDLKQRLGFIRALLYRRRIRNYSQAIGSIYADKARECGASYYRNAMYVSFVSGTAHDCAIAEVAVHELSHALWEKLAGEWLDEQLRVAEQRTPADHNKLELLVEGFAVYAQTVWFRDFYPACLRDNLHLAPSDRKSVYFRGFTWIQELVKQSGPQVLLEIPRQWKSLAVPPTS